MNRLAGRGWLVALGLVAACADGFDPSDRETFSEPPPRDEVPGHKDPAAMNAHARRWEPCGPVTRPPATPPASPCGVASAPPCGGFIDVTAEAGLSGAIPDSFVGDVVAFGDLDGDGWLDLARSGGDSVHVWRNLRDGTFVEATAALGLAGAPADTVVLPADVDGDARLDLLLMGFGFGDVWRGTDRGFELLAGALGPVPLTAAVTAAFADYDGDGDLDVFFAREPALDAPGYLLRNRGDGRFDDVTGPAGIAGPGTMTWQALWFDYDDDGDPDLTLANDRGNYFGIPTQLFRNDGGTFTEVTEAAGLLPPIDGMGLTAGDADGDLDLDLYVTNLPGVPLPGIGNLLFRNEADGTFTEVSALWGTSAPLVGWGTSFLDHDADGDLDLVAVGVAGAADPGIRFLENLGTGEFRDVTAEVGLADDGAAFGLSVGDYDLDGHPDLAIAHSTYGPPVALWRNLGGPRHWLGVRLRAPSPNAFGIGASLTAWVGGRPLRRAIDAGSGFGGGNPAEVLFGLGEVTTVDRLEVRWPGGSATTLTCVAADRWIEISP